MSLVNQINSTSKVEESANSPTISSEADIIQYIKSLSSIIRELQDLKV